METELKGAVRRSSRRMIIAFGVALAMGLTAVIISGGGSIAGCLNLFGHVTTVDENSKSNFSRYNGSNVSVSIQAVYDQYISTWHNPEENYYYLAEASNGALISICVEEEDREEVNDLYHLTIEGHKTDSVKAITVNGIVSKIENAETLERLQKGVTMLINSGMYQGTDTEIEKLVQPYKITVAAKGEGTDNSNLRYAVMILSALCLCMVLFIIMQCIKMTGKRSLKQLNVYLANHPEDSYADLEREFNQATQVVKSVWVSKKFTFYAGSKGAQVINNNLSVEILRVAA